MRFTISITFLLFLLTNCSEKKDAFITDEYLKIHQEWKDSRKEEVEKDWLPLIGLQWLDTGENTFGSDPENQIVFPDSAPPFIGTFLTYDDSVRMLIEPDQQVKSANIEAFNSSVLMKEGMKMTLHNLEWMIIKRTGKYAVRIWDRSPYQNDSVTLAYFETNAEWILDARFEAFPEGSTYPIVNVLGTVIDTPIPGQLLFKYDGIEYGLDVMVGGEDTWFVIFGDKTNGEETYGAGRYMYVPKVMHDRITQIDFNKAYSPPCAFTELATCPLPPLQNHLPFAIKAGEMHTNSEYLQEFGERDF